MFKVMARRPVHLFEPTGFGGIFQHTCALGELLARAGHAVTLHTATQHEPVLLPNVKLCTCSSWPRGRPHSRLRSAQIAANLVGRTLPHLYRAVPGRSVVHVEGGVASGALTALTLAVANRRGRTVVYSPHNTFSRRGTFDGLVLATCLRFSQSTVAYSQMDVATLRSRGAHSVLAPLIQLVPEPDPEAVARWRERWSATGGEQVVLFAGVVRPDKRLGLLVRAGEGGPARGGRGVVVGGGVGRRNTRLPPRVRAAGVWPAGRRLAGVGQERGH